MGIFSDLSKFGIENLDETELFKVPEPETKKKEEAQMAPKYREEDCVFTREYKCYVCGKPIKTKCVKASKIRRNGSDIDLRPRFATVDPSKYDVVVCPKCGYAALTRYYTSIPKVQQEAIRNKISRGFSWKPNEESPVVSYEEALERYKLALANAFVRSTKNSEKAYICLKAAWCARGYEESLDESLPDYEANLKKIKDQEDEFLKHALEGFISARQSESFPICDMDEHTLDYLMAALAMHFEQYDIASKLIGTILVSNANSRMKDKTRDLKEELIRQMKQGK